MAYPYIGEIRLFAGSFAPAGWAFCNGALLPISENDTLFTLIGTTYGGDGQDTFALPDLQGRVPVHHGGLSNYQLAESFGVEQVTLTVNQTPVHSHPVLASTQPATSSSPAGLIPAQAEEPMYVPPGAPELPLTPTTVAGSSQPHDNLQPYVGITYIISLFGLFPSPT